MGEPIFSQDEVDRHLSAVDGRPFNCHPCKNPKCNRMAGKHDYCDACRWMLSKALGAEEKSCANCTSCRFNFKSTEYDKRRCDSCMTDLNIRSNYKSEPQEEG